jgi:nitroimidazol reductase NimA-like FMN-containing flavoprotein (pyridoxamine 5'-phosphate oxidase superfamily)
MSWYRTLLSVSLCLSMKLVKIPRMEKDEYDRLIAESYVSRIAFFGEQYPYIAPFLYVFDGSYMYFLSTKYGYKIRHFQRNPHVSVEVERYSPDLSSYTFVTLSGRLVEVDATDEKEAVRERFVRLIKDKKLSNRVLAALGHSPDEPLENLITEERSLVWKLTDVKEIVALKNV